VNQRSGLWQGTLFYTIGTCRPYDQSTQHSARFCWFRLGLERSIGTRKHRNHGQKNNNTRKPSIIDQIYTSSTNRPLSFPKAQQSDSDHSYFLCCPFFVPIGKCRFSLRPLPERPSPSRWSLPTPLTTSSRRSRTRRVRFAFYFPFVSPPFLSFYLLTYDTLPYAEASIYRGRPGVENTNSRPRVPQDYLHNNDSHNSN